MIELNAFAEINDPNQTVEVLRASLEQIQVLRKIDKVIIEHNDVHASLKALIHIVATYFQADAVEILFFEGTQETFCRVAGCGFINSSFDIPFAAKEGLPGLALNSRTPVYLPDITQYDPIRVLPFYIQEKIISGYCVPLITPNKIQGVLQVFYRTKTVLEPVFVDFLEMVANQVAIAIEKTSLWENHQQALKELITVYATTLEGWVHALDLRDNETERHTRRVTDLAVEIAKVIELPVDALVNIRRGALLHDIGKIGIPDSILLKPGPLSEEEWIIMRQHPEFAKQMLAHVPYLQSAIDIPYCHHERWDGSGYPRGLKGAEIPLAARIFAVVDVWDALTTDRPYRKAWPEQKVIEYIEENAGILFDPSAVVAFFQVMNIPK